MDSPPNDNGRIDRLRRIRVDTDKDCQDKLDFIQDISTSNLKYLEMDLISDILQNCAEDEVEACLEVVSKIIKDNGSFLAEDLRDGLIEVGNSDIELTTQYVNDRLDWFDTERKRGLATCAAYLYRGNEQTFVNQFQLWYRKDKSFFGTIVGRMLRAYRQDSEEDVDEKFKDELQTVLKGLEQIARDEGLNPNQARRSKLIRQATILLEDIKYHHQDAGAQTLKRNIKDYPHLQSFLGKSRDWISEITQQNKHRLCFMLNHRWHRNDYRSWVRGPPPADHSGSPPSRFELNCIEILSYYDHCCEVLEPGDDQLSNLRDRFLDRNQFHSATTELSVINAFRREFGWDAVEIEPTEAKSGKRPDVKIDEGIGTVVWTEITRPARDIPFSAQEARTMPGDSNADPPRAYITKKVDGQLSAVKNSTDDLTMLVLGNQSPKIENWNVADYVLGDGLNVVPSDGDMSEIQFVRGESRLGHEDVEDLDILVNFRTMGDLGEPPYIRVRCSH